MDFLSVSANPPFTESLLNFTSNANVCQGQRQRGQKYISGLGAFFFFSSAFAICCHK